MRFTYSDAQISALLSEFTDPQVREATELAALPEMLQGISYFIECWPVRISRGQISTKCESRSGGSKPASDSGVEQNG